MQYIDLYPDSIFYTAKAVVGDAFLCNHPTRPDTAYHASPSVTGREIGVFLMATHVFPWKYNVYFGK